MQNKTRKLLGVSLIAMGIGLTASVISGHLSPPPASNDTAAKVAPSTRPPYRLGAEPEDTEQDNHATYQEAVEAVRDNHLGLTNAAVKEKFVNEWYGKFDNDPSLKSEEGLNKAIHQMLWSIGSPGSPGGGGYRFDYYMDKAATRDEDEQVEGHFGGIGASLTERHVVHQWRQRIIAKGKLDEADKKSLEAIHFEQPLVVAEDPDPGTPAAQAGIQKGDRLVAIDGVALSKLAYPRPTTYDIVVKRLHGLVDTQVKLTVARTSADGNEEQLDFNLVRRDVPTPVVRLHTAADGEVAHIAVSNFVSDLEPPLLADALQKAAKGKATILDLRRNPGGDYDHGIWSTEMLVECGQILKTTERKGDYLVTQTLTLTPSMLVTETVSTDPAKQPEYKFEPRKYQRILPPEMPLVVLINDGSASASEIVAGAVQETSHGACPSEAGAPKAVLVGTPSTAKGEGQVGVYLDDGRRKLHVTAFEFKPGGVPVNWAGIVPDMEVSLSDDAAPEEDPNSDNQLGKAFEELQSILAGNPPHMRIEADLEARRAELTKQNKEKFAREVEMRLKKLSEDKAE
jgi:C-terminal processing protease CtpA/Prc